MAWVLSQDPYNFNTRAVGMDKNYALIQLDEVHLHWADEIVCAEFEQSDQIYKMLTELKIDTKIVNLCIPDSYDYRDPVLCDLIRNRYKPHA